MLIILSVLLNNLFTYNKMENDLVQALYKLPRTEIVRPWDKNDLVAED